MKKIINVNNTSETTDIALLVARVGIAALMLTHGIPKLMMLLSGAPIQFPGMLGMSPELTLGLAIFAEVFCSLAILTGFATRLATVPLISTMLVAVLLVHSADPFTVKESGLTYLVGYTMLLFAGSGKYSIDYLLSREQRATPALVLIDK
ncbi:MAG: DoxX family protein [Bacteroidota bacterium]